MLSSKATAATTSSSVVAPVTAEPIQRQRNDAQRLHESPSDRDDDNEETITWDDSKAALDLRRLAKFQSPENWLCFNDKDDGEEPDDESDESSLRYDDTGAENVQNHKQQQEQHLLQLLPFRCTGSGVGVPVSRKRQRREAALQQRLGRVAVGATGKGTAVASAPRVRCSDSCTTASAATTPVPGMHHQYRYTSSRNNHGDTPLPTDGAADFVELLQQVQTPSPLAAATASNNPAVAMVHQKEEDDDSVFGDLLLSAQDLAHMDSLVQQVLTQQQQPNEPPEKQTSRMMFCGNNQSRNVGPPTTTATTMALSSNPSPRQSQFCKQMHAAAAQNQQPPRNEPTTQPPESKTSFDGTNRDKSTHCSNQSPRQVWNQPEQQPARAAAPKQQQPADDTNDDAMWDFGDVNLAALEENQCHAYNETTKQPHTNKLDGNKRDSSDDRTAVVQPELRQTPKHQASDNTNDDDDDDAMWDFGDVDLAALESQCLAAHQQQSSTLQHKPPAVSYLQFSRYQIVTVRTDPSFTKTLEAAPWTESLSASTTGHHRHRPHSVAAAALNGSSNSHSSTTLQQILLKGEWYHTPVQAGDVIHICSLSGKCATTTVSRSLNQRQHSCSSFLPLVLDTTADDDLVLIVHPEYLLTPTTISETVSCTRRAILKNRLGSTGLTNKAPLLGTLRHGLLEETMRQRQQTQSQAQQQTQPFNAARRQYSTTINYLVRQHAEGLLACGVSTTEAQRELHQFVPQLERFMTEFTSLTTSCGNQPPRALLVNSANQPSVRFFATQVEAIEEPVISPELGLKGNIDMMVHATTTSCTSSNSNTSSSLFGVELKTGHNQTTQNAHMAQLALYMIMLQARYGSPSSCTNNGTMPSSSFHGSRNSGMLLYMNHQDIRAVHMAPFMNEIKSLISQRNLVAIEQVRVSKPRGVVVLNYNADDEDDETGISIHLEDPTPAALPDLLPSAHSCTRCYANRECMTYAAAALHSASTPDESLLKSHGELLQIFAGHLSKEDLDYFTKWDRLIDLEADAGQTLIVSAWLIESEKRERETAKCISSVFFDETGSSVEKGDLSAYAIIAFQRSNESRLQTPLSNLGLEPGCHVVVSADRTLAINARPGVPLPRMHIVRGFLHRSTDTQVEVRASHDDLIRIQKLVLSGSADGHPMRFRLDRDDAATGTGTIRQNLINLFTGGLSTPSVQDGGSQPTWRSGRRLEVLRDIIVRLRLPGYELNVAHAMFNPRIGDSVSLPNIPGCDLMDLALEFAELNPDQAAAAEKVLAMKDCSLIQGLPGTGKSTIITFVARMLAAHGKRVLISAYTHAAVDNVMLKLMEKGLSSIDDTRPSPPLVRVGLKSSCHPGVHSILASSAAMAFESPIVETDAVVLPSAESLRKTIQSARIVGVTALSIPRSPLLRREDFDVVIVDEAGQISQPAVLGALLAADSFVLVGDHMQLPPLVSSEAAEKGGFGVSLLKRIADEHPSCVAQLTLQYRMHEDICQLSNDLVYQGKLVCANDQVRHRKLDLAGFPENIPAGTALWLMATIDPRKPVVFLDTDRMSIPNGTPNTSPDGVPQMALERNSGRGSGGSTVNDTEATLVCHVVNSLVKCGLRASSIGLVCPFRAQIRLLQESPSLKQLAHEGLEISTIDRYQGRDKPAIILSFVRSNLKHKVGRLLEDFRRLNVAITRAKCKLIMVGSFSTLFHGSDSLKPVLERVQRKGGVVQAPSGGIGHVC